MGRWAQRKRGGGGQISAYLNFLTAATIDSANFVSMDWFRPITASTLAANQFKTQPSGFVPFDVQQDGANGTLIEFIEDVSMETALHYDGDARANLSPQVVAF